jgi:alkylmercury lyase
MELVMLGHNADLRDLANRALRSRRPLGPTARRLLRVGYRALVEGEPVSLERLAGLAGLSIGELADLLAGLPGFSRYDSEGRVVGLLGLSAHCSLHRFDAVGRVVSTWCAWDSLFIPRVLGMRARVASHCPITKRLIQLVVAPDGVHDSSPSDVTVSYVIGGEPGVIGACCPDIHFLGSARAANVWLTSHPEGLVLTLDEAWELGRIFVDEVLLGEFASPLGGSSPAATESGLR